MQTAAAPPLASTAPRSLMASAVRGVQWTLGATLLMAAIQVGYTAIMARLLAPADFGLVTLAGIVLRFGSYFAAMGMEQALIQKPELTTRDVRAAFTSAVLLAVLFGGALILLAPLAGTAFRQPNVVPVVRALALGLVLTGLYATPVSLLRRTMRFRALAVAEVSSFTLGYMGVGVALAWAGWGAWSLVGAQLSQALLLALFSYATTRHSVRPLFHWPTYQPLLRYGGWSSVIGFCEYMTGELDKMSVSRIWGAAALGLYGRAWMLIALPLYQLAASITRVALPSFSQVQHEPERLRKAYSRGVLLTGAALMPVCAGAAVAAPELVRVLLGSQWAAAVPLVRVVCGVFALSTLNMLAASICDATAALPRKLLLTLGHAGLLLVLFAALRQVGLVGITWAVLAGEVLRTLFYLLLMRRVLALSLGALLANYGPGLLLGAGVAASIALAAHGLRPLSLPALVLLGAELLTGALALPVLVLVLPLSALRAEVSSHLHHLPLPGVPRLQRLLARRPFWSLA
ncbi:lipopolysaccharide biosynthesis protein [Hymenobacter sediminis]|uniref:lipopolysaccharide biosynthesis protein n=1 Tax=Hymenobacter sediminis TaxID=2218621 RepID=UPI000DA64100|nr:lipopolysaccharide biosynthesis protein [Hymenobacter sediminis]RPD44966.1 lipopolysaccharide biosynthesis protein [Hymenobacter sediminis]